MEDPAELLVLLATLRKIGFITILFVAGFAGGRNIVGSISNLFLILRLRRFVRGRCGIAQALHKLRPIRILQRDIDPARAFPPREDQQVGRFANAKAAFSTACHWP